MLKLETNKTYEQKIGNTVFIIESESPDQAIPDMVDALVNLMKRDIENLSENT